MAISRMQQPRQMYNQGMMVHDPRQAYGLGGFIKKAFRKVKKVAKSPIGKMALLGGLGMYAGGLGPFSGMRGAGFAKGLGGNLMSGLKSKSGFLGNVGNMFRKGGDENEGFSMGRMLAGGLGATALALPFLGGKEEPEEEEVQMDPALQTQRAKDYYSQTGTKGVGLDFMPDKQYVKQNFYAADGGRAGYAMGGGAANAQAEQMLQAEYIKYKNKGGDLSFEQFVQAVMQQQGQSQGMEQPTMMAANGGMAGMTVPGYGTPAGTNQFGYPSGGVRVGKADGGQLVSPSNDGSRPGYAGDEGILKTILDFPKNLKSGFGQIFSGEVGATLGGDQKTINEFLAKDMFGIEGEADEQTIQMIIDMNNRGAGVDEISSLTGKDNKFVTDIVSILTMKAYGGRIGRAEGGIMATDEASEMIDMGGQEKDYRDEGGFVAMGGEERADDVPARLSKNEFVFTADAVRNAGGGDIDRGSEVMQNLMDNLEQGGSVSADSQGLGGGEEMMMSEEMIEEPDGAQAMYEQQQALQSRMV